MKNPRDFATPAAWRNRGGSISNPLTHGLKPGASEKHPLYGQALITADS